MPLPFPRPGLVIAYAYLWLTDHRQGQIEGVKDRPCAIVLTTESAEGETVVTVAPITHSPPRDESTAVEIPAATKQRLGLDAKQFWVVVSEVNRFIWPGPDLRRIARDTPDRFDYGMLPPALFARIKTRLIECAQRRRAALIVREE